ncbi:MAG: hypothetical protein ABIJ04_07195 [Bacteroidota bacterium]
MKKQFTYLISIGILNFFLFGGVFKLLQNDKIYHNTLGVISENYERIGGWDNYEIKKTSKPFLQIKNDNFETWDAGIYKCISERMYKTENECYGKVRAAFFPLFPILWKITNSTPIGISIINYFLFIISIAFLVMFLLKTTIPNKLVTYSILITLPSTIIYYIPYTEALFLFTMTVAAIGIIKKKYWMFVVGSFLLSMVRPATVFILVAIMLAELIILIKNRNYRLLINEIIFKSLPFLIGYFCAIFIQYLYSDSWTALIEAQKYWAGEVRLIKGITDWSVEGFGLSSFAIFFVCLPVMLFVLFLFIKWNKIAIREFILKIKNYNIEYLFLISIFYLMGIFIFTLITSGGNLHSFFRFTLASPLFYIAVLALLNYLFEKPVKIFVLLFIILNLFLILFLNFVDYGGGRMQFSFFGLYMFIVTGLFIIIKNIISQPTQIVIMLVLIVLNTIWNAYLLNTFFSNGWIFT